MSAKVRYPILFPVYFGLGMSVDIYVEYVHDMYAFTALETFIFLCTAISSRIFQYLRIHLTYTARIQFIGIAKLPGIESPLYLNFVI